MVAGKGGCSLLRQRQLVRNGLALFLLAGRSVIAPRQQVSSSRDASQKLKPATGIPATAKIIMSQSACGKGEDGPAALRVAGNRGIS